VIQNLGLAGVAPNLSKEKDTKTNKNTTGNYIMENRNEMMARGVGGLRTELGTQVQTATGIKHIVSLKKTSSKSVDWEKRKNQQ